MFLSPVSNVAGLLYKTKKKALVKTLIEAGKKVSSFRVKRDQH